MIRWLIVFISSLAIKAEAQDFHSIQFVPKFGNHHLELNTEYTLGNDKITFTNLKFYVADLSFFLKDSLIHRPDQKVYLIDVSDVNSLKIFTNTKSPFDRITFKIGIDSVTNVAGALDGDLDPVHGMYWTWQSGYINFKLEGIASNCPARLHKFYWHIGGYLQPFAAQRCIELKGNFSKIKNVNIQIDELFKYIDISQTYNVMSPSVHAIEIADRLARIFKITD